MTDERTQEAAVHSNMEKNPKDWVAGDGPMTGAQQQTDDTPESEVGEEDPGAALEMMMAEPDESTSPSPDARPEDKPLQSPMPRSPGLENEEPEFTNERDIPTEDKPTDQPGRGSARVQVGPY
jgi:hypothetical protein